MLYTEQKGIKRYRWKELGLLIIPSLILLLAMTQLLLAANADPQSTLSTANVPTIHDLIPIFGMIGTLLAANVVMSIFFRKADQMLLPVAGLLSGLGVMMATRLGPDLPRFYRDPALGSKQLVWVLVGIVVCLATVFILRKMDWLARYKYTWIALGFLSLAYSVYQGIITFKSGLPTHDTLPFINIQPSEFLKICIVVFFAAYLNENRDMLAQGFLRLGFLRLPPLRQLGPLVVMLGLSLLIFLVVRELGLALMIYGLFLCMTYLGSGKLGYVVASLFTFAVLAFIGYSLLGYVRARFATVGIDVVNWTAKSDAEYFNGSLQVVQGLIALASGGIFGSGLGLGAPTFVPVAHEDMVLTAMGEELGLAGLFALLGLYLLIVYRGFRIAIESRDPFHQLLAAGLTSVFALQTLIISAGNLKLMPLTGIPLPFISYGGSSVLANYIIIGILLRISYNNALEREGML